MSIIIQNMGGPSDGVCSYELRINRDTVATFEHDRRDGLAECLRVAAMAVDDAETLALLLKASEDVTQKQIQQLAEMMGMK